MRAKILGLLRERVQEPVSGEEISAKLGVSRTAVWKHIQSLKNVGYDIESVPKKGYILHKSPDLLSPEEIVAHLETKWVGHHVHYLKEASSSNEVGMAAVAVIKAINKYKGVNAKIKWPNDVLLEGKKMVGILTEMSAEFGKINYIVIGTGINTNVPKSMIPDELKDLAISVADVAREPIQRVQILADYLKNMEDLYETVLREGFGPVLDEWRTYSDTIGQAVKVIAPDKTYFGTAVDIDKEGLLIVKKEDGTMEKVIAGDVSIRPAGIPLFIMSAV